MEIKIGMVVWKKSGSPAMTIKSKHTSGNEWNCTWFDENEVKQWRFSADELTDTNPISPEPRNPIGFDYTNSNS